MNDDHDNRLDDDALHHRIRAADRRRYPLDQPDPEADARIREALIRLADGIGLPDDVLAAEDYPSANHWAQPEGGFMTLRDWVDQGAHVDQFGNVQIGPCVPPLGPFGVSAATPWRGWWDTDPSSWVAPRLTEAQDRARYARRRLGMAASHCRAAWNAIRYGDTPDLW